MNTAIKTEVYQRGPARFDMVGQQLPTHLSLTADGISPGLAKRLLRYGERTLCDHGFDKLVSDWQPSVFTLDADEAPADRTYCVNWTNEKGGSIQVVGIYTRHGWPFLDHGLDIQRS